MAREFPIISGKRFWDFRLNELVDLFSHQVNRYSIELPDEPKAVADAVIRDIQYPFYLGQPDDTHLLNCFHGNYRFCKRVDLDFWQKASETVLLKVGDCEDSSILGTALSGKLVGADKVYEIFGEVRDAETGETLGGHGWYLCCWGGKWHLIESTLDTPPQEYPVVVHIRSPYRLEGILYCPEVLFNWKNYTELRPIAEYLRLGFKAKETKRKYQAISRAWHQKAKPIKKAGVLSRVRWK